MIKRNLDTIVEHLKENKETEDYFSKKDEIELLIENYNPIHFQRVVLETNSLLFN